MANTIEKLILSGPPAIPEKVIHLDGSKSISNRVLIMRALSGQNFSIPHLSEADDTRVLNQLLSNPSEIFDVGHAGTSFRFLTAYLAFQPGTQVLTGSQRMKERPIGPLVRALNHLGADIVYLEKDNYPPLEIRPFSGKQLHPGVVIPGDISSQYISALLMVAPVLENGLRIEIKGELVSVPYVEMTLKIMAYFGIGYTWENAEIYIPHQNYRGKEFAVESDWSAASYHFAIANAFNKARFALSGLFEDSLQGDAAIRAIAAKFGVKSYFDSKGLLQIEKDKHYPVEPLQLDLLRTPDLAQTIAVMCAMRGVKGVFSGLKTLKIKETDRIFAMQTELKKFGVRFDPMDPGDTSVSGDERYQVEGRANSADQVTIKTYKDHRMAMALAPLSVICPMEIEDPGVVAKSYPGFWDDLEQLGFEIRLPIHQG